MTEIYCVSCGEFVMGQETEGGEGICPKCKEQIEKIVNEGWIAERYDAHA